MDFGGKSYSPARANPLTFPPGYFVSGYLFLKLFMECYSFLDMLLELCLLLVTSKSQTRCEAGAESHGSPKEPEKAGLPGKAVRLFFSGDLIKEVMDNQVDRGHPA
jgi:hypothetical protein